MRVMLRWPIAGALFGALGSLNALIAIGAVMNGVPVSHKWEMFSAVLCPAAIVVRGFWPPLVLNCVFYAGMVWALRFAWVWCRGAIADRQTRAL